VVCATGNYRLRRRSCVTTDGISMLGAAVLLASSCDGFKNMALQPLHAWNGVS